MVLPVVVGGVDIEQQTEKTARLTGLGTGTVHKLKREMVAA